MHKELIKHISDDKIKEYFSDILSMIRETDYELYEKIEDYLYKEAYGCHFSEWLLEKALSNLKNEDGTTGGHWTVEQTTSVAKSLNISFDTFNIYDWNYVMNMLYSDFYGAVTNDAVVYGKLAKKFLTDKDGKEGKAYHYYMAMAK